MPPIEEAQLFALMAWSLPVILGVHAAGTRLAREVKVRRRHRRIVRINALPNNGFPS